MKFFNAKPSCTVKGLLTVIFLIILFLPGCGGESSNKGDNGAATETLVLAAPVRIAVLDDATLLVTDYLQNKVFFVDKATLDIDKAISISGQPTGIVFFEDKIIVGNLSKGRVEVYNEDGDYLYQVGGSETVFGQVNDLVADKTLENLYVLDSRGKTVTSFDLNNLVNPGTELISPAQLQNPAALEVDVLTGNLYVSDYGVLSNLFDSKVLAFTAAGGLVSQYNLGAAAPQGLYAWNENNNLYAFIADAKYSKILLQNLTTSSSGVPIGELGNREGQLIYPLDVYVDSINRDVFVADNRNGRITVFRGGGVVQ